MKAKAEERTRILYEFPISKGEENVLRKQSEQAKREAEKCRKREVAQSKQAVEEMMKQEQIDFNNIFDEVYQAVCLENPGEFRSLREVKIKNHKQLAPYKGYFTICGSKANFHLRKAVQEVCKGKKPAFLKNVSEKSSAKPKSVKNSTPQSAGKRNDISSYIYERLLNCDQRRAMLPVYDEKLLKDPNRGHWDLWDLTIPQKASRVKLNEGITARNPAIDIVDGLVGIDFGTKSTVVVCMDDRSEVRPLRIGGRDYAGKTDAKYYENPTVMQFINIAAFMKAYRARVGRPFTSCEDLMVSHRAFENFKNSNSDLYYSFFTDLKRWCSKEGTRKKFRDGKGHIEELLPFMEIGEGDMNPLEIYAYYLGLYINNMMAQEIFMDYILSFPVTFSPEVCEKIRASFEAGIRKSLPTALLADKEAMQSFRVRRGTNEPAAYAVTALKQYGFDPRGDDDCYYGVFDFGGGTTDFDFGVYRDAKHDRYDYRLLHFGANGDKTLGGENLLRLMAFEIFRANSEILLHPSGDGKSDAAKIPFTYAADETRFRNADLLIRDSQEAHANMHALMERLRPIWENPDSQEAKEIIGNKSIKLNLFDENGKQITNLELSHENLELENILRVRIEKGVRSFFLAMREAFLFGAKNRDYGIKPLDKIKEVSIFLAGNSSKSALVQKVFDDCLDADGDEGAACLLGLSKANMPKFILYPALGTDAAKQKMETMDIQPAEDEAAPTGKTGVAFGLLECRESGIIDVVDVVPDKDEQPFLYYIGRNRRGKFSTVIDRQTKLGQWHDFIDAGGDFEIYYTDNPEAKTNCAPLAIARMIRVPVIKRDANKRVYIRPVSARAIEYTIADYVPRGREKPEKKETYSRIELH